MKERDYHYATPPRDTRRTSPRHSFPTIKVLAYNINNVFPYGNNVKCCIADVRYVKFNAIINLTFAVGSSVKTAPIIMFTFAFENNYVRKSNAPVIDLLLSKTFKSYDKAITFKERVYNTLYNQFDSVMEHYQKIDKVVETLYRESSCSVAGSIAFELHSKARKRLDSVSIASAALEEDLNHLIIND